MTVLYAYGPFFSGGVAPYTYSISAGSLPPGLSILGDNNTAGYPGGTIYGTPTTAGTSYFTFKVTDSANPPDIATQNLSVTINPAGTLTISPSTLNNGEVGAFYDQLPTISGTTQSYTTSITAGALPPGLRLGSDNSIYGTPTTAGTYSFTYQAVDSSNAPNVGNANYTITILPTGTFTISTTALPSGEVGVSYSQQPLTSGGIQPYTFSLSAGALPPGVSLNTSTGSISGVPTAAGTYNFTYQATDFSIPPKTATAPLSIKIIPALTIVAPTSLPNASVGTVYASPPVQVTGGTPPYSFSASPFQQQTNSTNGTISFVPATIGVQSVTISVMDSLAATASTTLSLTVDPANCPNNANFQGNYAMLFNGPPYVQLHGGFGQTLFLGSFVADGAGSISQGYIDNPGAVTLTGLTGTYCIGPNNQGTLIYPGPNGQVYLMNLDSSGNAEFMVYQNPYVVPFPFGFGSLAKQDTAAFSASAFVGQYSFGLSGNGQGSDGLQGGAFFNDGAGNLNNGELDQVGTGNPFNATFTANNFAVAPFGRGTVTINESSGATVSDIFYVVNSSKLFAVATTSAPGYFAGPIVQSTGGPYTNASLNGISVFGLQGGTGTLDSQIGLITWDGNGNFTLTADQNQSGNPTAGTLTTVSYSGTYNVDSDGRVTLVSSGESLPPVLYLSGPNQGFMVGLGLDTPVGQFFQQSAGPFQSGAFSGSYLGSMLNTFIPVFTPSFVETELDSFSADGVGTLTGTTNLDGQLSGPLSVEVSSTYTVDSSGRGLVGASGSPTYIFYIVSPTQVLMMPNKPGPRVLSVTQP
jgi:hypothetical protein